MNGRYPIAASAVEACSPDALRANTFRQALGASSNPSSCKLTVDWIALPNKKLDTLLGPLSEQDARHFISRYETIAGTAVLAVSYWKIEPHGCETDPPYNQESIVSVQLDLFEPTQ